ncbi:carbohydrate kinase family protein [Chitinophaga sp. CF418]|uniref:carbohydrate kinase family protein n=1 Tax=Chitinophaga sp. CF418 TaxID=1855287 RepID=UPI0009141F28|nr:PfkB family carbohydrate kinase [Chitinophaga sp. CF418]SHN22426.1 fructokinase [Chitinophaga sp. CF418]
MTNYNIVSLGEILWDILPEQELPGGAPLNVAYHLHKHSQRVVLVSGIGNDNHGQRLLDIMQEHGLATDLIQRDNRYDTGKVYARMDEKMDMQYDIVYPVAWDHISWDATLEATFRNDDLQYLVYGSLLARNDISRNTLEKALQSKARKVLDINLRAPYYSKETLEWLLLSCDLLKLNIGELELISSWYNQFTTSEDRIQALSEQFNIPTIIVTLGSKGCMGYIQGEFYYQEGQPVKVADTIGSGDAFLAGFLTSQIRSCTPAYSLAYANALGALVASKPGGCPDYHPQEITDMIIKKQTYVSTGQ